MEDNLLEAGWAGGHHLDLAHREGLDFVLHPVPHFSPSHTRIPIFE